MSLSRATRRSPHSALRPAVLPLGLTGRERGAATVVNADGRSPRHAAVTLGPAHAAPAMQAWVTPARAPSLDSETHWLGTSAQSTVGVWSRSVVPARKPAPDAWTSVGRLDCHRSCSGAGGARWYLHASVAEGGDGSGGRWRGRPAAGRGQDD